MAKKQAVINEPTIRQQGAITIIEQDVGAGWEQWYCLMSDNHWDSPMCDRELEERHLEEARARNAKIMIFGDLFDAMQGRFDPRRSMEELRPEYRSSNYYDLLVDDFANHYGKYADLLTLICDGNHESAVVKNASTNLPERLISILRRDYKSNVIHGGYGGWVCWRFKISTVGKPINLKYFHGAGGDAPVSRGVLWTNRQAVYLGDAHIVVNGHNHNAYYVPIARERITIDCKQYMDIQHHIRIPGYKQSYGDGSRGWDVERGGPPKPVGCCWVKLSCDFADKAQKTNNGGNIRINVYPDVEGGAVLESMGAGYTGKVYADDNEGY